MKRKIHWASTPTGVCDRKDQRADESVMSKAGATCLVVNSGNANHPGNVTCGTCRAYLRSLGRSDKPEHQGTVLP